MNATNPGTAQLAEVGLLADPVRRRLYDFVARQQEPATRDDAARSVGISRSLAAYHLDKLAAAGLLDTSYARAAGRGGPGSGRPAKRYARSEQEISVSLPPRNYSLLARIVATAADSSPDPAFRSALFEAARDEGTALGESASDLSALLTAVGYEPGLGDGGDIVLRNCPFHSVVEAHTELACGLNLAFISGALCGAGGDPGTAVLSPAAGRCCVLIHSERAERAEDAESTRNATERTA